MARPHVERSEKQSVRRPSAARVMNAVRADDRPEVPALQQYRHGEALVHEPVVHDDVGDAEGRHPDAQAVGDLPPPPRSREAPVEDRSHRDRSVEDAERVVRLEVPCARLVMRSVDAPEPAVPHPPVKERCPRLHEERDDQSDRRPDERGVEGAHLPAPEPRT